jgi:cysteinyl-tRNA synthetase
MKLFNSLTQKKEEFQPLDDNVVTLYSCGPTVYDFPHIGNLRTFLFGDLLCRVLRHKGFETTR